MFRILVPVDFSDESVKASQYALDVAATIPQAQVLLLHCFQDYLADTDTDTPPPLEVVACEEVAAQVINRNLEEAEDDLEELYQQLCTEAINRNIQVSIERAFINGLPEEVILDEAKRFKPNLIVMGTKGEANISRAFFGTVTTKIVQELEIPVLTIPRAYNGTPPSKVAYATNFDSEDAKALIQLTRLLAPFNPAIHCVHISASESEKDQQHLSDLKDKLTRNCPEANIRYTLLEGSKVAKTLHQFILDQHVNLLALTTHKRSGFGNILHPSLTQKLLLESEIPLLVFHSPKKV